MALLAACSQQPAEQPPAKQESEILGAARTSPPAPDQPAGGGDACRGEVVAAFNRLKTSGRPYREETAITIGGRTYRETVEFVPPDRLRLSDNSAWIMHRYYVRIGPRAWANWSPFPWGWREEYPDDRLIQMKLAANADYAAALNLPPRAYTCLGRVEFAGTAYLGYRSRVERMVVMFVPSGASHATRDPELDRKLAQMPQEWRTVLLDPVSKLPAYDLTAQENQLDHPSATVRYTYPSAIDIKPPLWCRLRLCGARVW